MLEVTKTALGGAPLSGLRSRSLRLSRFSDPGLKQDPRARFFTDAFAIPPATVVACSPLDRWLTWLQSGLKLAPTDLIFGKLQSRLALHLSGGVMENAGILLDRFGFPFIPGSGVKGIARRSALHALHTWSVDNRGVRPEDRSEPATAICDGFQTADELAVAIFRTFGWTDGEWKDGRTRKGEFRSDFEWAIGEGQPWLDVRPRIAEQLASRHGTKLAKGRPAANYAGLARFLEAKPIAAGYPKAPGDLELDVVTCHHGDYYAGKLAEAHDTEDPVPVVFPTVAPGITFVFAIHGPDPTANSFARACLKVALSTFGAGAKTAAGYGFFTDVTNDYVARQAKEAEAKRRDDEAAAAKARQTAEFAASKAREAARAAMTPEQRADAVLADRAADWGWMKQHLTRFPQHPPEVQAALLRWFCGAGKARWLAEIKPEAAKGRKPWSQIIGAIHAARKAHKINLP